MKKVTYFLILFALVVSSTIVAPPVIAQNAAGNSPVLYTLRVTIQGGMMQDLKNIGGGFQAGVELFNRAELFLTLNKPFGYDEPVLGGLGGGIRGYVMPADFPVNLSLGAEYLSVLDYYFSYNAASEVPLGGLLFPVALSGRMNNARVSFAYLVPWYLPDSVSAEFENAEWEGSLQLSDLNAKRNPFFRPDPSYFYGLRFSLAFYF